jgi:hypothetical protein
VEVTGLDPSAELLDRFAAELSRQPRSGPGSGATRSRGGRAHTPAELDATLAAFGRRPERWFGVRVFSDHRDGRAPSGDELDQLLAAEHEAGRRDPYRSVAALFHLTYSKSE